MSKSIIASVMATALLAACGGLIPINSYGGSDAALMPPTCGDQVVADPSGKRYVVYNSINNIDGSYTSGGESCRKSFAYRIKPGTRRIRTIPNLNSDENPFILFAIVNVVADLKPGGHYSMSSSYDGSSIKVQIVEAETGRVVGEAASSDVKTSSKDNAALQATTLKLK